MSYLAGFSGGTGSGKGTFAGLVKDHLEAWGLGVFVFSTDNCYRDLSYLPRKERDEMCFNPDFNFDHPDVVDWDRLVTYAKNLKNGIPFEFTTYNFDTHSYEGGKKVQVPGSADVTVVEGILALWEPRLLELYDYKVFVDTDPTLAALRRIKRDIEDRGRNIEQVVRQMSTTVAKMQRKYAFPTKDEADDVVNWRTDETKPAEQIKKDLVALARQKALYIYEQVRRPLLSELSLDKVIIPGIE